MYQENYNKNYGNYIPNYYNSSNTKGVQKDGDDRFFGGFAVPFLLGGVAGAALSPGFGFGKPYYYSNNYYYPPYPPYPYYYPPRPYPYY